MLYYSVLEDCCTFIVPTDFKYYESRYTPYRYFIWRIRSTRVLKFTTLNYYYKLQ